MSGPAASRFSLLRVFLASLLLLVPFGAYAAWQCRLAIWSEKVDFGKVYTGYLKRTGTPTKLVEGFTDRDDDLVADVPIDPAKQLNPDELVFAPIAGSARDTEETWREFVAHLAKTTGKKVTFTTYEVHQPQIEALKEGKLHVTGFNTGYVSAAVNGAGFVPHAAMAKADGSYSFRMQIIVPADSPINSLADLKAKTLMVTGAGSHSGYKAPLVFLRETSNLTPKQDYEVVISGGHMQSIQSIVKHQAQAAAVASDMVEEAIDDPERGVKKDQFRVVFESKEFPKAAFGFTSRLKPELAAKVREAFVTFDFKGTKLEQKTRGSHAVRFVPVDYKKDWANVRMVDEKLLNWQ